MIDSRLFEEIMTVLTCNPGIVTYLVQRPGGTVGAQRAHGHTGYKIMGGVSTPSAPKPHAVTC